MYAVLLHLAAFCIPGMAASERHSLKFNASLGPGAVSVKPTLDVVRRRSRIECALSCAAYPECGGLNTAAVAAGGVRCELKHGITYRDQTGRENGTTYYEMTDQNATTKSRDCFDLLNEGVAVSGVYEINLALEGFTPDLIQVYCDMDTSGGGWTTLIKRQDGSESFDRNWSDYKKGFGNVHGEYWLGLENMYNLTNNGKIYTVRVDMRLFTGESGYAEYNAFTILSEADDYKLQISGYTGNTSDAFSYHDNMKFSTTDRDNDLYVVKNCAQMYHAGLWFNKCSHARLTGLYGEYQSDNQGILWLDWLSESTHPQYIDMKIRPKLTPTNDTD